MITKQKFYNFYHKKNDQFYKIIKKNNFTYYEILRFFYSNAITKFSNLKKIEVLDIGCGVGTLSLYFASLGMKVNGIDVSSRAINIAKKAKNQLELKNAHFFNKLLQKGSKKYNFILISEVIEHIEDEKDFLRKVKSQLNDNGLLLLTTPLKNNCLYKLGFYKNFDKEVGHLRRYTPESIIKLLKKNGFSIIKYRQVEGPLRNLLFTTKLGFAIKFIRGPLIPIFHKIDWVSMKLFGASDILILAKKVVS